MTLNIGVIGAGFMGDVHLACWEDIESTAIAGIVEKEGDRRKEAVEDYGVDGFSSLEELFAAKDVDAIDICVPTPYHVELVKKSLEGVGSVICEKPVARTLSGAREIKQLTRKREADVYVGHVLRFFPEYVRIRDRILDGAVGKVGVVRTFRGGAPPATRAGWYMDLEKSGGLILDMLIHDFDWLLWTIGDIESVYTRGRSFKSGYRDFALINLGFASGGMAHVEGSWAHPTDFPFSTGLEVAGDDGMIEFDSAVATPVTVYTKSSAEKEGTGAPKSPLAKNPWCSQLEHFAGCILEGKEPRVTLEDSIRALRVSLASLESLRQDEPIDVGDYDG